MYQHDIYNFYFINAVKTFTFKALEKFKIN